MNPFKIELELNKFNVQELDFTDIFEVEQRLPRSGVFDLNIAEVGLLDTLRGENLCQDKIVLIDRYIGFLDGEKNKAWSNAALTKAKASGYKTAKDKEWFAAADEDYIVVSNKLTLAKATKRWLEKKAGSFEKWHYAFKTFLRRDYSVENSAGIKYGAYNNKAWEGGTSRPSESSSICNDDDMVWGD